MGDDHGQIQQYKDVVREVWPKAADFSTNWGWLVRDATTDAILGCGRSRKDAWRNTVEEVLDSGAIPDQGVAALRLVQEWLSLESGCTWRDILHAIGNLNYQTWVRTSRLERANARLKKEKQELEAKLTTANQRARQLVRDHAETGDRLNAALAALREREDKSMSDQADAPMRPFQPVASPPNDLMRLFLPEPQRVGEVQPGSWIRPEGDDVDYLLSSMRMKSECFAVAADGLVAMLPIDTMVQVSSTPDESKAWRESVGQKMVKLDMSEEEIADALAGYRPIITTMPEPWREIAEQNQRNADHYRDLLLQAAKHLGPAVYVQDDGGVSEEPLLAKVPGLVGDLAQAMALGGPFVRYSNGKSHHVSGHTCGDSAWPASVDITTEWAGKDTACVTRYIPEDERGRLYGKLLDEAHRMVQALKDLGRQVEKPASAIPGAVDGSEVIDLDNYKHVLLAPGRDGARANGDSPGWRRGLVPTTGGPLHVWFDTHEEDGGCLYLALRGGDPETRTRDAAEAERVAKLLGFDFVDPAAGGLDGWWLHHDERKSAKPVATPATIYPCAIGGILFAPRGLAIDMTTRDGRLSDESVERIEACYRAMEERGQFPGQVWVDATCGMAFVVTQVPEEGLSPHPKHRLVWDPRLGVERSR